MRLFRWVVGTQTPLPDPRTEPERYDEEIELREIAWSRLTDTARAALQVWRPIKDQISILNPLHEPKDQVRVVRFDAFLASCRWQGIDPDDPWAQEVWELVRMLCDVEYSEGRSHSNLCFHESLRYEVAMWCGSCMELFDPLGEHHTWGMG